MPYRALSIIAKILRFLAILSALVALLGGVGVAIASFYGGGPPGGAAIPGLPLWLGALLAVLVGAVVAFIAWLLFKAYAETIELALAGERFLRESNEHLRVLAARTMVGGEGAR